VRKDIIIVGLNHRSAPIEVRESVAFESSYIRDALGRLHEYPAIQEGVILSTCNRVEVVAAAGDCQTASKEISQFLDEQRAQKHPESLDRHVYVYQGPEAVRHLFRVAASLDSMVVGEPQILGQMKQAVRQAEQAGTLGFLLHKLFQRTFSVAKDVRTQTEIGANLVSMAAAAVKLAERIFPSISEQRVLFIGAGEMIELNAVHFAARSPKHITVANRTIERAQVLARRINGHAITLTDLPEQLAQHDIIVTCTASPLPILGKGMVERALKARKHRPLFIVDLAVPRDVEIEVAELNDVFLYSVDDIAEVVKDGLDARQGAVKEAEVIIDSSVLEFIHWMESREVVPVIRALRDHAERNRRHELEKALRLLAKGDNPEKVLEAMSSSLTNKFLHAPTHALNQVHSGDREAFLEVIHRLYHIQSDE